MDDKEKEYKEKYQKKCKRVSQLLKENKLLEKRLSRAVKNRDNAWSAKNEYMDVVDCLENKFYKIKFKAKDNKGGVSDFEETILSRHPTLVEKEIKDRKYENYKFLSIEIMT